MSEKMKDKIRALLAKAEGTDNEFEAETFMAKVNELLERHQIEMHEVRKDADPMGHERGEVNLYASMSWAADLVFKVAKYYGGDAVCHKHGNHLRYTVIGRESVRTTIEIMLPYILTQLRRAAKKYAQHYGYTASVSQKQVANALIVRLWNLTAARNEHRADLVGKGLIPVSDNEAYLNELYPKVKTARARSLSHTVTASKLAEGISLAAQTDQIKRKAIK